MVGQAAQAVREMDQSTVTCAFERACSLRAPDHASIPGIGNRVTAVTFEAMLARVDRPSANLHCRPGAGESLGRRSRTGVSRWFRPERRTGTRRRARYRCIAV